MTAGKEEPACRPNRNDVIEFARRTRKNLAFVEQGARQGEDVHVVTQVAVSMLALVVFPTERLLDEQMRGVTLASLAGSEWPAWNLDPDDPKRPTVTLGDLMRRLRNGIAHGRLRFDSDSRAIEDVCFLITDGPDGNESVVSWRARISGVDLKKFCARFIDFVDDSLA